VDIEYQIKIVAEKWQSERDENERQDKHFLPHLHVIIFRQTPAAGYEQKSENVFGKKVKTKKLGRILFVAKR
jgi:hypothetical protein